MHQQVVVQEVLREEEGGGGGGEGLERTVWEEELGVGVTWTKSGMKLM